MPSAPFIPTQQPDASIGRRYSKAFKYVFAMMKAGEDLTSIDSGENASSASGLIDEGRFAVLTLPQQIQIRSPYATVVTVMQNGGKVIESKGNVMHVGTISGTTGFLPPSAAVPLQPTYGRLVPNVTDIDGHLGALSGYLAFQKLRYLFLQYGEERRRGNLDVAFYFFDYKNDDFWRIEPDSFDMSRSSRRPMSYDYNVQFKCIERADPVVKPAQDLGPFTIGQIGLASQLRGGLNLKASGGFGAAPKQGMLITNGRFLELFASGLDFLRHCDTVVQRSFQFALNKLEAVVGFFENIHDTFFTLLEIVPTLLAQLNNSLAGLFRTIDKFAPDNVAQELNEWALEVTRLSDHLAAQVRSVIASQSQRDVTDTDQRFSQGRMRQGSTTDLMQEPVGSAGSPDANPFIGSSGLSLITDVHGLAGTSRYVTVTINSGEDIYALARRVFGRIERFVDLVLINKLEFPFIVADAGNKPANTLAWGESILVPAPDGGSTSTTSGIADASSVPTTSGVVTTPSLPSQLIDTTALWRTDQWVGYSVTATTAGASQTLVCLSNTSTQLTLNGNWSITITPTVTTYVVAYVQFNPRRPLTPEARAYGVDLLVVFGNDGRCDVTLGATRDLALAEGLDNLIQAITLRARCPLGEHPFHKRYGMPSPVGRPFTDNVGALYTFFIRASLLSDPRIGKVRNIQLDLNGDTLQLSAEVQPIDSRVARSITTKVGA